MGPNEEGPEPRQPVNPDSAVRRALLWWFQAPATPWVSFSFAVDFSAARAYLDGLEGSPRVTVQHLLAAAIARTLADAPLANAQIVRNRIILRDRVGVAMPVNLLGHPGGSKRELGVALVLDADRLSLRELARSSSSSVKEEREGRSTNFFVKAITSAAEHVPQRLFFRAMEAFETVRKLPMAHDLIFKAIPVTTLLSNAGAPFQNEPGFLFRGGAVAPPARLGHVGTVWGTSVVQDEVVAVDGAPAVRPMLPVLLVFDHRLIDGVAAGRLAVSFARVLADPATHFGPQGNQPGRAEG